MPATTGRARGRQGVRSGAQGAVGEHMPKITTALVAVLAVIIAALALTKPGRSIDAATQRFMLFYAGVFALIGLSAAVAVGLVATDRIIMTPGHRVMAQAVHRAVSFGALAFLVIHIVTEILAQRSHVIDSVVPFLSPYRTFYIGLGTIASDLILFIIVSSIFRKRFTAHGKAWRWRAIHYSAYLAFVFGVLHGLLGGRAAKPYVDWSYGFTIALAALALVVRFLAISLRSNQQVHAPHGADRAAGSLGYSATSPLRTAALRMAQAQLGGTLQPMPAATGLPGMGEGRPDGQPWAELPAARGWAASSGPLPALSAAPVADFYPAPADLRSMPLGAPAYADVPAAGTAGYPYIASDAPQPLAAGPAARQTWYEPEYDGPPRFVGAPRRHVPQDDRSSYPYAPASWQLTRGGSTGPMPRVGSGPMPRLGTGPMPRVDSGPMPNPGTGPAPRSATGPMSRAAATGPMPRVDSGPMRRLDSGPMRRLDSGPMPWLGTGSAPRTDTGPLPRVDGGPAARPATGPQPRFGTGPMPRPSSGQVPPGATGPAPRPGRGPMPRIGDGPTPQTTTGGRPGPDPDPRTATGSMPTVYPRRARSANAAHRRTREIAGRRRGDEWR